MIYEANHSERYVNMKFFCFYRFYLENTRTTQELECFEYKLYVGCSCNKSRLL
jgi:hypothetical protein